MAQKTDYTQVPFVPTQIAREWAPGYTGALATSEAAANVIFNYDIPPLDRPQFIFGTFFPWVTANSTAGTKQMHAGVQFYVTGSGSATDSNEHITSVYTDTATTTRSVGAVPFGAVIGPGESLSVRGIQWGSYPGSVSVADGNGIAYEIFRI